MFRSIERIRIEIKMVVDKGLHNMHNMQCICIVYCSFGASFDNGDGDFTMMIVDRWDIPCWTATR